MRRIVAVAALLLLTGCHERTWQPSEPDTRARAAPPAALLAPKTGVASGCEDPGLTQTEIFVVLLDYASDSHVCLNWRLRAQEQALAGLIDTRFVIDAHGGVSWIALDEDTVPDPLVGQCVVGAMRRWRFPRPRCGTPVPVTYRWRFGTEE